MKSMLIAILFFKKQTICCLIVSKVELNSLEDGVELEQKLRKSEGDNKV